MGLLEQKVLDAVSPVTSVSSSREELRERRHCSHDMALVTAASTFFGDRAYALYLGHALNIVFVRAPSLGELHTPPDTRLDEYGRA